MSHTFTAKQTDYWKQQAYALMVHEGMSARFAKGQLETELFLDDIEAGEDIAYCPSCSLKIRVLMDEN